MFNKKESALDVDELEKPAEVILYQEGGWRCTYTPLSEIVLYHLYVYKVYFHDVSPPPSYFLPITVQSFDMFLSLVDAWEVSEVGDKHCIIERFHVFPVVLKQYLSINSRTHITRWKLPKL